MQNVFHCISQTLKPSQMLANAAFEPRPAVLDFVEVGRIGRQIEKLSPRLLNQLLNASAFVKGGVIQNHHLPRLQHGHQAGFHPGFKHHPITSPFNRERSQEVLSAPCRNHVDSSCSASSFECMEAFSARIPPVAILVSVVHACLIDVHPLCYRNCCQLFYEGLSVRFIPFLVAIRLFFRVKPILCKAREIVRALICPSQSSAISA